MKLSRNQKFSAIIGLGLLMLIGIGVVSYRYTSAFIASVEERKESYEILAALDGMLSDLKNAVLAVDIDRFKSINDVFGFGAGDEILKVLAERLSASANAGDTVGRIGSDEFGMVLHDLARPADAVPVVKEIMKRISQTIAFKREEIILTPTVGVAIYPTDGKKAETLMKKADFALSKA